MLQTRLGIVLQTRLAKSHHFLVMDSEEDTASELKLFLETINDTVSKTGDALMFGNLTRLVILKRTLSAQTGVTTLFFIRMNILRIMRLKISEI